MIRFMSNNSFHFVIWTCREAHSFARNRNSFSTIKLLIKTEVKLPPYPLNSADILASSFNRSDRSSLCVKVLRYHDSAVVQGKNEFLIEDSNFFGSPFVQILSNFFLSILQTNTRDFLFWFIKIGHWEPILAFENCHSVWFHTIRRK